MQTRKLRVVIALVAGVALLLVGCESAKQTTPAEAAAPPSATAVVVNRFENAARGDGGPGDSSAIFVTRAVIVEKENDKWAEVLRCDEHLKNPRGYLGGSPAAPVTGWRLEFKPDTDQGLELRFTPAGTGEERSSAAAETLARTITIRWNTKAKRYQSLDQSHRGYLGEAPALETPQSILK